MQNRYRDLERNWLNELSKRSHTRILKTHTFWMSYIALTPEGILWILYASQDKSYLRGFIPLILYCIYFSFLLKYYMYCIEDIILVFLYVTKDVKHNSRPFTIALGFIFSLFIFLLKKQLHCNKTTLK